MDLEDLTIPGFEALALALTQNNDTRLRELVENAQTADLATFLLNQDVDTCLRVLRVLEQQGQAELLGYLDIETQLDIAELMPDQELAELLIRMPADDRVDMFNRLGTRQQDALLRRMVKEEQDELRSLSSHEEGTAGALMTSDYAVIPVGSKVEQALAYLRATAPDAETIYQLYLLDDEHKLVGTLSLRDLILARPDTAVSELMTRDVLAVHVDTEQEDVAKLISRYDLLAIPVLDGEDRMVGIITYDDAMDVAEEEATEDIHKSATVGKLTDGLRKSSLFTLYRKLAGWLVLLVFVNLFSGAGIAYFEDIVATYLVLIFFLPLLIGSAGNAGSQAATLMVRGMATGEVQLKDWAVMLGREVAVASALGLTMAGAVAMVAYYRGGPDIALVVALSMVSVVVVGSLVGMLLPFILGKLNFDPATASAPLVASIADVTGVLVYFSIATFVLGLTATA
jgi:magnesium transporter